MLEQVFLQFQEQLGAGFSVLISTAFVWVPSILGVTFFCLWMEYSRAKFIQSQGSVLLEIKLPQEILKSPAVMELVFVQLYQAKKVSYLEGYFKGEVRPWFSLEFVSFGGEVHFDIWTPAKYKRVVENSIYSQYPEVEIYEVEDYSKSLYYDTDKNTHWFTNFKLTGKDIYPIKTYIDYGLDKDPKEEFKVDPMSPLMEYLGGLKKGEMVLIQILIQAHRELTWKDAVFPKKDWKDSAKKEVEKIIKESHFEDSETPGITHITEGKRDIIQAIERSIGKFAFETMIRGYYIAEKNAFDGSTITGLIGCLRQFSANNRNGFKLGKFSSFQYPWQDFHNFRKRKIEKTMIDAYKRRSYFNFPHKHYRNKPFILTTEELATVFHFPGKVIATPTLSRVPSRKAEPPANLPV